MRVIGFRIQESYRSEGRSESRSDCGSKGGSGDRSEWAVHTWPARSARVACVEDCTQCPNLSSEAACAAATGAL